MWKENWNAIKEKPWTWTINSLEGEINWPGYELLLEQIKLIRVR